MMQSLFRRSRSAGRARAYGDILPADLQRRLVAGEDLVLVDVRTTQEYALDGHIAGSRLIPLSVLGARADELPRDVPLVCVCRSGNRSQMAAEILAQRGFAEIYNLTSGVLGWRRAGLPVVH